jgi:hypothetical protein
LGEAADADGAGVAEGVPDAPQLLNGHAKDPAIPEIEQSSGLAAAMRPPTAVANMAVTIAADDKASIERIDLFLSQSRSAPTDHAWRHAGHEASGTLQQRRHVLVQRRIDGKAVAGNLPTRHAELTQPAARLWH